MALDHNKVPSVEEVRGGVPTCGICGGELGLGWASGRRTVPLRGGALLGGQGQTCADRLVGRTQTGVGVPLWFRGRLLPGGGEGPRAGPVLGRVGHLLQRRFDGCVGSEVEQALHGQGGGHGAGPEVADASAAKGKRAVVAFSTLLQNSKNKTHLIFFSLVGYICSGNTGIVVTRITMHSTCITLWTDTDISLFLLNWM